MKTNKKITRTFIFTVADVVAYNENNDNVYSDTETLIGKMDVKETKKALDEKYNDTCISVVKVKNVSYVEKLFGITEEDFLSLATELPPRKVNETQEDV